MATKKDNKKAAPPQKPAGKKSAKSAFLGIIIGIAAVFFLPITMLVVCGMLPTAVMLLTDRSKGKNLAVCVGTLNLTGVVHLIITLLRKGMSFDYAMAILREPANWLVMWGGAGIGYMLFTLIPPVVAQVLAVMADFKIQKFKANQIELAKTWSDKVKGQ